MRRRSTWLLGVTLAVACAALLLATLVGPLRSGRRSSPGPGGAASPRGSCPPAPPARGIDAYRRWDKLAYLELGDRVWGQSTADPAGSNTDNRQVLGNLPGGGRVLFDQTGPGVVTFLRHQEAVGSPWTLELDGRRATNVSTADLGQADPATQPARAFPFPLSLHPDQSQGSSILSGSIPFARRMRWLSAAPNGNFYSIYRKVPYGTPLRTWNGTEDVSGAAALLRAAGSDPAPPGLPEEAGSVTLPANTETTLLALSGGPRQVRALTLSAPLPLAASLGEARLRIWWDGEPAPSVDAPVKFLAGDGAGVYRPPDRPLVRGLLAGITADATTMSFRLSWPMPFRSTARIAIVSRHSLDGVRWSVRHEPFPDTAPWGTFHATYTSVASPPRGQDMVFLDASGSGRIVGFVVNFSKVGPTLEGDPRIYLDDSATAQIAVTGTEEWGLGGNYWREGHQTSLALGGMPSSEANPPGSEVDGAALYRFLIADSVPFNRHATVMWEHGGADETTVPYRAVVLWYGTKAETAVLSDELRLDDPLSRSTHAYSAPGARNYSLTAAYEHTVHAPVTTDSGMSHSASSTFTLALRPDNVGAFLRRTLDYGVANQRADVYVDGQLAGTWYSAGSSSGLDDDGRARRWRQEEFPLPPSLTAGKALVTIEMRFVPTQDPPSTAWTEFDYRAYSLVAPPCG